MSTKPHNVFISWSGPRSKHVAVELKEWLRAIVQTAKPWMSESDIDKGARGIEEIGKALSDIKIGIVCLTPENLDSKWILFEAGALSKTLDDKTRLCTYLLGGLEPADVPQPLGMFQATKATKDDTKRLIKTINAAVNEEPLADSTIDTLFESLWPKLEEHIKNMPGQKAAVKRPTEEMVAEILDIVRGMRPSPPWFGELWSIPEEGNFNRLKVLLTNSINTLVCGKCGSTGGIVATDEGMRCASCGALNSSMSMIPQPPIESKAE
jgi:TIR domain